MAVNRLFYLLQKESSSSSPLQISLAKTGFQNAFIRLSANPSIYNITVNVGGYSAIRHNRTISFHVEPSLLLSYNSSTGNHFELLPDSVYKITNPNIQFTPGQSPAQLPVRIEIKNRSVH